MKTVYNAKKKRKRLLLAELKKGTFLSITNICTLLNCSRRTAYNYLSEIEESGFIFDKTTVNGHSYYKLSPANDPKQSDSDLSDYDEMTFEDLREYAIMQSLQSAPLTRSNLISRFDLKELNTATDNQIAIDIGKSKMYSLINKLIQEGSLVEIVSANNASNCLFLSGNTTDLQLNLSEEELLQMHFELTFSLRGAPYIPQLQNLYDKVCMQLGIFDNEMPFHKNYLLYGSSKTGRLQAYDNMRTLLAVDFRNRALYITYKSRQQELISTIFFTGLIMFCSEKDTYYLVGKELFADTEFRNTIIDISSIKEIVPHASHNTFFQSHEFIQLSQEMFSISMDPPYKVKILFEHTANVARKVYNLHKQRPQSQIHENEYSILYADVVRGLHDFANYLRHFGRSVKVIEPIELKKIMQHSIVKSLERYKEI